MPDDSSGFATKHPQTCLHCLAMAARYHGIELAVERLQHTYAIADSPVSRGLLLRMATNAGLRARATRLTWDRLAQLRQAYPALAALANGNWVVVTAVGTNATGEEAIEVLDPLAERAEPLVLPKAVFQAKWSGEVVLLKRGAVPGDVPRPFGFRWFIPELLRQKRLFGEVAVAAIMLYALSLMVPIFFQLVVDKVLVHETFMTLYVLAIGVTVGLVFDAIFAFLRRYLLLFATNRIDIRVATRTFAHLLELPISFFERMSAGVLVRHMQQASRVREFLTGRLFLTTLDAMSLFVFLPVLYFYSTKLTLVVLGFAATIACIIAVLIGPFRRRLHALYQAEAQRQGLLVESVHGMRTVKSLAIEPMQKRVWDDRSAQAVAMRYRVEKISAIAQSVTGLLEKLMSVAIICFGALDVFTGAMTVGALIAFNMLAGRVSAPLVQIVTMVHEYQEIAIAVQMLGEVMNQRPERDHARPGLRPELAGQIEFDSITFRYRPEVAPALDDVSFSIPAGTVFGIVGRSGSGKTTLTRLIQGLYPIQQGLLRIDGFDARELDLVHLRAAIGVVLQDNFLFRGTVRDNIACVKPDAGFDQVAQAARIAGADEFIERLPRGFDTMLEENAENLSGGQKQRLAIARALLTDPRILILDEATSALDPESEAIIRTNLRRIAAGRTVIIVSHRLSMLAEAKAILVLDRGRLAGLGAHEQLLARCPTYRQLWNQQMRRVA